MTGHTEHHTPSPSPLPLGGEGNVLYLFDYELLGQPSDGLTLISQLQIADCAILVTSRYEEPSIRKRCRELGVRLIPKGLAGFVPIAPLPLCKGELEEVATSTPPLSTPYKGEESALQPDCVLIDDDDMIHTMWKLQGKAVGKVVRAFAAADEFFSIAPTMKKITPIYVDSNLGEGVKGEEGAKIIHEMGFENIYLATGYREEEFGPLPWIKGIIGKSPPW